jgi:[FeFe] hydrogenase H-cluster maturation GTPase HydF
MTKGKENKPHIGIYGRRNVGKSSLINSLSGQQVSIVSEQKGTTTDPVKRSFEIAGFGPVIFIDTAGIDDFGEIGEMRINKTYSTIDKIDLAIIVVTNNDFGNYEIDLIKQLNKFDTPFFIVHNKSDREPLTATLRDEITTNFHVPVLDFSTKKHVDAEIIFETIKNILPELSWVIKSMLGGIVNRGDIVLLVTPIDIEAPEGRLILPQVQTIRDVLDNGSIAIVLKETELEYFLAKKTQIIPKLVITDSQVFHKVSAIIPEDVPLTGFSILLARYKGDFENYLKGTPKISELKDNDKVLILESCSHHIACDDIGRVKIPNWLTNYTGKKLEFVVVAGLDNIPGKITDYALVVQCGGCMITKKQIINRLRPAVDAGIPVTNYGMMIAYVQGVYNRAIKIFDN